MVQVIEQPDIGERIGKAFGEGLSEQLPKALDRKQLSQQLQGIEGLPPEIAKLAGAPGGRELLPAIMPYIQEQRKRNALAAKEQFKPPIGAQENIAASPELPAAPLKKPEKSTGLASEEQIREANKKILQPATIESRDALANKLIQRGEALYVDEARQMAQQQLDQDRLVQKEQLANLRKGISDRMELDLQGTGLGDFGDVSGEFQKKLLDEAQTRFLNGESPQDIERDVSQVLTDLGKVATQTKSLGTWERAFDPKANIDTVKRHKEEFDQYGFGEVYEDLATASLGITPLQMASELHPISNEKFKKSVNSNKPSKWSGGFLGEAVPVSESAYNAMVESIQPEDNILSMASFLRDHGIEISEFMNKAKQKKGITPEQKRQLNKRSSNSFMGDILFRAFK